MKAIAAVLSKFAEQRNTMHEKMRGLFTILKVRDGLAGYDDPGWYQKNGPAPSPRQSREANLPDHPNEQAHQHPS